MNPSKILLAASAMGIGALMFPAGLFAHCGDKMAPCGKKISATKVEVIRIHPVALKAKCAPAKAEKTVKFEKSAKLMKCEPVVVKKVEFKCEPVTVKKVAVKCAPVKKVAVKCAEVDTCKFADISHMGDFNYIPVARNDFWFKNPEDRFSCGGNENLTDAANWAMLRQVQCGNLQPKISSVRVMQPVCAPTTFYSRRVSMPACPPKTFVARQTTCQPVSSACLSRPFIRVRQVCPPVAQPIFAQRPCNAVSTCTTCPSSTNKRVIQFSNPDQGAFQASAWQGNQVGTMQTVGSRGVFYPDRARFIDSGGNMHMWNNWGGNY